MYNLYGDIMKKNIKDVWGKLVLFFNKIFKSNKNDENSFAFGEVCLIILCTAVICTLVGILLDKKMFSNESKYSSHLKELIDNYQYIVGSYYTDVDEDKLVDAAINGIISELGDDYSNYFSSDESDNFDKVLTGSYDGIGVQVGQYSNGDIVIVSIFENTSAEKAGLKVGDVVKKINDKSVDGLTVKDVSTLIKDATGEKIYIDIVRDDEEKKIEVVREKVVLKSVEYEILEKNGKKVGYIYISIFSLNTSIQMKEALDALEGEVDSIILDVRNNSGGHLTSAEEILSLFLDSSNIIYKMDVNGDVTSYYSKGSKTKKYPIAIIINGESASASEMLAIAMQEKYGALIVGVNSFGKGTVQQKVQLSTGASYKVTTKKWLSPNGVWINGVGVTPDIYIEGSDNWYNYSHENDVQLQKALLEITR